MGKPEVLPARKAWKAYYRQMRIVRRESMKALVDVMLFGTGCVEMGTHLPDLIRYVPFGEVRIPA